MSDSVVVPDLSQFSAVLAVELRLRPAQVKATARLLDEGATVPFIAHSQGP
jgi:transcriptional accessory protein Tex/SPT6